MTARFSRRALLTIALAGLVACGDGFSLFDPRAPVLDGIFVLDSAGAVRPPVTRQDSVNERQVLVADTLFFSSDGQLDRRGWMWFVYYNGVRWDSGLGPVSGTGWYRRTGSEAAVWLSIGTPAPQADTLALIGDTVAITAFDQVIHARLRYRRVAP